MGKKFLPILLVIGIVIVLGGIVLVASQTVRQPERELTQSVSEVDTEGNLAEFKFEDPKKSAHYESNTPAHGAILGGAPVNVVIDFNFDLASNSTISILKGSTEYGVGSTKVDSNKLSMRRAISPNTPDGLYTVKYNACWPDKTCHDGSFQFAIDRNKGQSFSDMTGKKEVTIRMSDIKFNPSEIVIDKGTKVTWMNDDNETHYVNTDSHPAHTYLLDMNSKALEKGDSYSYIFKSEGFYPYHCSAHETLMKGAILVQ